MTRPGEDATTTGMESAGFYDAHSEYQRRVVEGGEAALKGLIGELDLDDGSGLLTIVDYGAGTGATSVSAVGTAISAIDSASPGLAIAAIHNDVFTSDFSGLFANVAGDQGYLSRSGGRVYPMAAGGSFFDQVVPAGTVRLGMCSNAAHWLRHQPELETPTTMYYAGAEGSARQALAEAAAEDWLAFCQSRVAELAPGGAILVQGIATIEEDGQVKASAGLLLEQMWTVAKELAGEGLIDEKLLDSYVLPVYCRSAAEGAAPVEAGGPLAGTLEVVSSVVEEVANPYWELLEKSGDSEAYARDYTAFVRGFSGSTMLEHLFQPAARGIEPKELEDEYFRRLEKATAADPDAGRYECWILRIALRRIAT